MSGPLAMDEVGDEVGLRQAQPASSGAQPGSSGARPGSSGAQPGSSADEARAAVARRLTPVVLRIGRRIRPTSGELSAGHFSTLATLHRHGPQRPSDLARTERFAPPAVARVVGALEDRGLVTRRPSPDDARSSLIEITAEGVRLLMAIRHEQAEAVARLLEALDDEELAVLARAIEPLERVALTRDAGADGSCR